MKIQGVGTERIEDEVQQLFPEARILRMDLDTTRNKTAYQDIINAFAKHECDILIGTQMITKGLHFNDVQLVGVINADPLLNQPDFRAYERAYQMLEQVAGRSGRSGNRGKVLIQTFDIANPLYPMIQTHDYEQLYRSQLGERELFHYPPFHRLICVQLRHHDARRAEEAASILQQRLSLIFGNRVSGVVVPSVARLQAYHIRHVLLRIEQGASLSGAKQRLRQAIDYTLSQQEAKGIQILIDVDPM
jgi:primosomal protein N' (replication factor Y)